MLVQTDGVQKVFVERALRCDVVIVGVVEIYAYSGKLGKQHGSHSFDSIGFACSAFSNKNIPGRAQEDNRLDDLVHLLDRFRG